MHIPWFTDFIVLAQEGGGGFGGLGSFMPIILIFAIFWFLIIRPQSKKQKERERKVQAARKGDNVLTHGGIYGKIVKATDEDIVLEVDKHSKTRIQFTRTAILDIIDSAAVQDDASESEETTTSKAEAEAEVPPIPDS